jgi:hypothetical protein
MREGFFMTGDSIAAVERPTKCDRIGAVVAGKSRASFRRIQYENRAAERTTHDGCGLAPVSRTDEDSIYLEEAPRYA